MNRDRISHLTVDDPAQAQYDTEHVYIPEIDPQNPQYDPSFPVPPSHDPAYPGWILPSDVSMLPSNGGNQFPVDQPPQYNDLSHPEQQQQQPAQDEKEYGLHPFLGVKARIYLAIASPLIVAGILIGLRLLFMGNDTQAMGEKVKEEIRDVCNGVESGKSALAALPALMKASTIKHIEKTSNAVVSGLGGALITILSIAEALLIFFIEAYQSLYLCILQFVIFGGLALVEAAVKEVTDGLNSVLPQIGSGIKGDVDKFVGAVNTVIGGVNTALAGAVSVQNQITSGAASVGGKISSFFGGIFARGGIEVDPIVAIHLARQEPSRDAIVNTVARVTARALPDMVQDVAATATITARAFLETEAVKNALVVRADPIVVGTVKLPDLSVLDNITIPTDFLGEITKLNDSIPTLQDAHDFVEKYISIPFKMGESAINNSIGALRFNTTSVLTNSSAMSLRNGNYTKCANLDLSAVDNVVQESVKWLHIVIGVLIAGAILYLAAIAFIQYRAWASLRNAIQVARVAWMQDHPGQQMNVSGMLSLMHYVAAPFLFNLFMRIPALRKNPARDTTRWFLAWFAHPYSLALLAFTLVGIAIYTAQIEILELIVKPKYRNNAQVAALLDGLTGDTTSMMLAESAAFANACNREIMRMENFINDKVFPPVDSALTAVNSTVTFVINLLDKYVDVVFGKTFLKDSATTFVACVITDKLRVVVKGITWLESELNVNMTLVDQDVIVPSSEAIKAMSSSNSSDSNYITKIVDNLIEKLERDRLPFIYLFCFWIFVVLIGFGYAIYSCRNMHDQDVFPGEYDQPEPEPTRESTYNEKRAMSYISETQQDNTWDPDAQGPHPADDRSLPPRPQSVFSYRQTATDLPSQSLRQMSTSANSNSRGLKVSPANRESWNQVDDGAPIPQSPAYTEFDENPPKKKTTAMRLRDSLATFVPGKSRKSTFPDDKRGW